MAMEVGEQDDLRAKQGGRSLGPAGPAHPGHPGIQMAKA